MAPKKISLKPAVLEYLCKKYERGELEDGIVTSDLVVEAIRATGVDLGKANPANFLKDIVRSENANSIWPEALKKKRITARQQYGETRVLQFLPYAAGQSEPFPDRFGPSRRTRVHEVQSASMSFVARRLGRPEESWLTQIVVNLRLVETQLSLFSPMGPRLRDVTHLQMGMKTQPEIDAVFMASFGPEETPKAPADMYMLITCEAKQRGQRILEDQIREQVRIAMMHTKKMKVPAISAVKPMAIKVVARKFGGQVENAIYVIEFQGILRSEFDAKWIHKTDTGLYSMPLKAVSQTIYRILPSVGGLHSPGGTSMRTVHRREARR